MNFDPHELGLITKTRDKEQFILFTLFVGGGKTGWVQAKKLEQFLAFGKSSLGPIDTPFQILHRLCVLNELNAALKYAKTGQYDRLHRTLTELGSTTQDVLSWSRDRWTLLHGVGLKTASFIIMYTKQDPGPIAVLDRHVLAWLKTQGYPIKHANTPPSWKTYAAYEAYYADAAKKHGGTVRELDQIIWRKYAKKEKKSGDG